MNIPSMEGASELQIPPPALFARGAERNMRRYTRERFFSVINGSLFRYLRRSSLTPRQYLPSSAVRRSSSFSADKSRR